MQQRYIIALLTACCVSAAFAADPIVDAAKKSAHEAKIAEHDAKIAEHQAKRDARKN